MGDKENKSRGIRMVLGVLLFLSLLGFGGLLAVVGIGEVMAYGARSFSFFATHIWVPITIPMGLFYLLLLGAVASPLLMGRSMYRKFLSKDQIWRQYRTDTFFWAEWLWDYTWKGKITKLYCECEKCAERMKPKVVPEGNDEVGVRFICNRCGKQSTTIRSAESVEEALDRVEKKILRKIRVGKFRGAIEGKSLEDEGGGAAG